MNKKQKEAMIAMEIKVAGLEEAVRRHKICIDAHNTRLSDHDESIEALDETAVELSPCKCQAGELLKRIEKLDLEIVRADAFRQNHIERIVKLELENVNAGRQGEMNRAYTELAKQSKEQDARLTFFAGTVGEINAELKKVLMGRLLDIGWLGEESKHVETLQKEVKALKSANMGRTNALLEQTQRVDKLFAWIERLNGSVDQIVENRRAVPKRQGDIKPLIFPNGSVDRIIENRRAVPKKQGEIKPLVFFKSTVSGSGGGVQEKKPGRPRKAKSVGIQGGKENE